VKAASDLDAALERGGQGVVNRTVRPREFQWLSRTRATKLDARPLPVVSPAVGCEPVSHPSAGLSFARVGMLAGGVLLAVVHDDAPYAMGACKPQQSSAPNPKFAQCRRQIGSRTSGSKGH
jgi:hypothetical protein